MGAPRKGAARSVNTCARCYTRVTLAGSRRLRATLAAAPVLFCGLCVVIEAEDSRLMTAAPQVQSDFTRGC